MAGFLHRALLDAGDPARHGHHEPRLGQVGAPVHLLDEITQHPLGHVEVGNDPVLERTHRHDVARGAADHAFSLGAHGDDLAVVRIERDHRRFVQHDAASTHVDQRVRSAEIDRHVTAEERQRVAHRERDLPIRAGDLELSAWMVLHAVERAGGSTWTMVTPTHRVPERRSSRAWASPLPDADDSPLPPSLPTIRRATGAPDRRHAGVRGPRKRYAGRSRGDSRAGGVRPRGCSEPPAS